LQFVYTKKDHICVRYTMCYWLRDGRPIWVRACFSKIMCY